MTVEVENIFWFCFIIWRQSTIEVFHPNHVYISSVLCKVHSVPFRRQPWLTRKHQHRLVKSRHGCHYTIFSSRKHFAKKSQQFNSAFCMQAIGASEWDGGARNETIFVATFGRNWKCCFEIQPWNIPGWKTMIIMCDPVAVITGFVTGFCTDGKPTPCIWFVCCEGIAVQPRVYSRFLSAPAGTESIGLLGWTVITKCLV